MDEEIILEADTLTRSYEGAAAVDELSLRLRDGEFFSLLGPSGCGKTTTLRLLAGLERPDTGSIRLNGADVTNTAASDRATNLVFQDLVLFPHLTVAQNIAYGPARQGLSTADQRTRVDKLLEVVNLAGYNERDPADLSGGQRQRVALARALANEPSVVLLDEPLSSLDRGLREELQRELKRIQRDVGTTFLYVTHDQASAMRMSDRMAVMNRGRIVEAGPPEMLYSTPSTPFVAEFLGDGPVLELPAERQCGRPVVTLADMTIPVADDEETAHPRGDPAARTVMIRPEHVTLGEGTLSGTVVSTAYRGYFSEVTVRLPDGTELMTRGPAATWAHGDEIGVRVDRAHPVEPDVAADAD